MATDGFKEMRAALTSLGKKGSDCVRKAQRDAAKVEQAACVAGAPEITGATKAAIKVRAAKRKKNRIAMLVTLGKDFFQGKTFYAAFNIFGHHIGKRHSHNPKQQARYETLVGKPRKFIPGKNWMKEAWNGEADRAAKVWETNMKTYLDDAIEKAKAGS